MPPLEFLDPTHVRQGRKKLIYFGGCDYFRLSWHPKVRAAVSEGMREFGLSVAASRVTTGEHPLYLKLERELARFFGVEAAALSSSGYLSNTLFAQAWAGRFTHVLIDSRSHSALADAAKFFNAPTLLFPHRDAAALRRMVGQLGTKTRPVLLTDSVFAHSGELAPLNDYLKLLPPTAILLVDDAHGAGILGIRGRGTAETLGVQDRRIVQSLSLSKAFGVFGGAVLGTREWIEPIRSQSRAFSGSTPLPLPLVCGALQSLTLLRSHRSLGRRLQRNIELTRNLLAESGVKIPSDPTPNICINPSSGGAREQLRRALLSRRVFPSFIQYPPGDRHGFFRFAISSEHSERQLHALAKACGDFIS